MKSFRKVLLLAACLFFFSFLYGQQLRPGFDKEEYKELMYVSARTCGLSPDYYANLPEPQEYKMVYQSAVTGLDNRWDLWSSNKPLAVISIRGTTDKAESWLSNFYAAMVPAKGVLQLNNQEKFEYELSSHPKAAVHVGWLLGMAYLSKDILPKIDSSYQAGTREFYLVGHSQGGAITFLLTAYLYRLQKAGKLPADIRFKTYCSAGPKPGNLYFAYEYEAMTQQGWAYNVVNSADWVPETPISIQTLNDFNPTNPFADAGKVIKKQKFPQRLVLKHVYKKLNKPTWKAQRNYEKYLGKMTSKLVKNNLTEFVPPVYYKSNSYVRTGTTIVLYADDLYYQTYPDDPKKIFNHHFHHPYLLLLERLEK